MRELAKGELSVRQIAKLAKVTPRRVRQLREHFERTGACWSLVVERKKRLPPRSPEDEELVLLLRKNYHVGATFIEQMLRKEGKPLPHNFIQGVLNANSLARPLAKKVKRKAWVRYERKHSNTMWHTDWTQLKNGDWLVAYEDDASRFITGYGVFDSPTTENSLTVLRGAIAAHGKPKTMLTGHDVQFYSNPADGIAKEPNGFQKFLAANGIQHILGRVNHPQTNGKIERFFGTVKTKLPEFNNLDELIHWYNHVKPHMSLNFDELETPAEAFHRKLHHKTKNTKKQAVIVEASQ